jgi:hypothetical protein
VVMGLSVPRGFREALVAIVNTRDGATLDGPDNVWQGIARAALDAAGAEHDEPTSVAPSRGQCA